MTEVVLVEPEAGKLNRIIGKSVPLGLLYVSAYLAQEGYRIKIIDQAMEPSWERSLIAALRQEPICVGITAMTGPQITRGIEIAEVVRKHSEVPIVWGGVHPSLLPKQTVEDPYVDIVVQGEGDLTFYELVRAIEKERPLDKVKGIWYKTEGNGRIHHTPPREFVDLNALPPLPYGIVDMKMYLKSWVDHGYSYLLPLTTSRGCPYRCTYCYNTTFNRRRWRAAGVERVIEDLKRVVDDYGVKAVYFEDDNFFVSLKRADGVMKKVLEERLDVKMVFQGVRIDTVTRMSREMLRNLERAGAEWFHMGVESGSPRILKLIGKGITVEQILMANRRLTQYPSIKPYYNFMLGFPTEGKEDLFMSTRLALRLLKENPNAELKVFSLYKPYPGTELYATALAHKFREPRSLREWGLQYWHHFDSTSTPWVSQRMKKILKKIVYTSLGVDRKAEHYFESPFVRALLRTYRPIAQFRFKHNFYGFMPETLVDLL